LLGLFRIENVVHQSHGHKSDLQLLFVTASTDRKTKVRSVYHTTYVMGVNGDGESINPRGGQIKTAHLGKQPRRWSSPPQGSGQAPERPTGIPG